MEYEVRKKMNQTEEKLPKVYIDRMKDGSTVYAGWCEYHLKKLAEDLRKATNIWLTTFIHRTRVNLYTKTGVKMSFNLLVPLQHIHKVPHVGPMLKKRGIQ